MKQYHKWVKVKQKNPGYNRWYDYYEYYIPDEESQTDQTYYERLKKGSSAPAWVKGKDF